MSGSTVPPHHPSRRDFLTGAGALIVSFAMPMAVARDSTASSARWPARIDKEMLDFRIVGGHGDGQLPP